MELIAKPRSNVSDVEICNYVCDRRFAWKCCDDQGEGCHVGEGRADPGQKPQNETQTEQSRRWREVFYKSAMKNILLKICEQNDIMYKSN
jgi:hypothetical protein